MSEPLPIHYTQAEALAFSTLLGVFFDRLSKADPRLRTVVAQSLEQTAAIMETAAMSVVVAPATAENYAPNLPHALKMIDIIGAFVEREEGGQKSGV